MKQHETNPRDMPKVAPQIACPSKPTAGPQVACLCCTPIIESCSWSCSGLRWHKVDNNFVSPEIQPKLKCNSRPELQHKHVTRHPAGVQGLSFVLHSSHLCCTAHSAVAKLIVQERAAAVRILGVWVCCSPRPSLDMAYNTPTSMVSALLQPCPWI